MSTSNCNTEVLLSIGDIRRELGTPPMRRLRYAIESAGIEPRARIGPAYAYSPDQVPAIRAALDGVKPCPRRAR